MNCCSECFSSNYIKDIINRNNEVGICDFCGSTNVSIYNPEELNLFFRPIFDLYSIDNENGKSINEQIITDFNGKIFSEKAERKLTKLLKEIIRDDYGSFKPLFENNVILSFKKEADKQDLIKPLQISWKNFATEIKTINRFHIQNTIDLDKLEILIKRYQKPVKKGKIFYRARISDKNGFSCDRMFNPPAEKTKSGRANPIGISYLYLADTEKTTLYEVRATLYDYVTIGKFRLKEDINVINLSGDTYDPILLEDYENGSLEDFLIHQPFINKLELELSKPKRRSDTELDYLPTQYLSEFIKSIDFDGVEYQSSLYSKGYNLAIFSTHKIECIDVNVYEIEKLNLEFKELTEL
ncbi:MAG: hypothetical protein B6D61_01725 [Bacteroidetes bacterium 4484_249]|nr:MAG: hypothetical protein B6D61_01725 [Bacteroidetes bacterium 4484_249]